MNWGPLVLKLSGSCSILKWTELVSAHFTTQDASYVAHDSWGSRRCTRSVYKCPKRRTYIETVKIFAQPLLCVWIMQEKCFCLNGNRALDLFYLFIYFGDPEKLIVFFEKKREKEEAWKMTLFYIFIASMNTKNTTAIWKETNVTLLLLQKKILLSLIQTRVYTKCVNEQNINSNYP